jgi:hypothetical protein
MAAQQKEKQTDYTFWNDLKEKPKKDACSSLASHL